MQSITQFETIKSFHARLKAVTNKKYINFGKPEYGKIVFIGENRQEETYYETPENDDWMFISFSDVKLCLICDVLAILEPLIEKHGNKQVLYHRRFIPTTTKEKSEVYKVEIVPSVTYAQTDMNPWKKFVSEYNKVKVVLEGENDILMSWIRKRIPEIGDIYIVGSKLHFGIQSFLSTYPLLSEKCELVFKKDEVCPRIHTCILSQDELNIYGLGSLSRDMLSSMLKERLAKIK